MKSTLKLACVICAGLLFAVLSRTASAQSVSGGTCFATAPVYSSGTLSAVAYGDLYSVIVGEQGYYKVTLLIDGVVYFSNAGTKSVGVALPYSIPGYVFDFEPSISGLASGAHVAQWMGVVNPINVGSTNVGSFSFTTDFTVP